MKRLFCIQRLLILLGAVFYSATGVFSQEITPNPTDKTVTASSTPNVIIVLADDLGYGDLSCYGATAIQTPHIDKLAREGLRFTQGFATSSTCTPSRFALLTGKYPCRQQGVHILPGNAAMIIRPGSLTLPELFSNAGYSTGAVGKWHLGLGNGAINWNAPISPSLKDIGFQQSFIMAATNDRTPTVYIENGNVVNLDQADPLKVNYQKNFDGEPTYKSNPELVTKQKSVNGHMDSVHNGVGRIGFQQGGVSARWTDETMAELFKEKSEVFIRAAVKQNKPFFLYYALHQPHVPRMPGKNFSGKSALGLRGDVILEADWQVGELTALLEELNISDNTIVIFTSDNGPVLNDGYAEQAVIKNEQAGHKPSGILRGGKYSNFEGGARVPFIVYAPKNVAPGTSEALICQVDFIASFAAMLGIDNSELNTLDSQNTFSAFMGQSPDGRSELLVNTNTIRTPKWHFIPNNNPAGGQLFNMLSDPSETTNVAKDKPRIVKQLKEQYNELRNKK